jgi:beta-galactosidase
VIGAHVLYGGDYNPEQWPEEIWAEDARLMGEAGVNLVSVGIFSWSRLEPRPQEYELDWLDRVLDLLHAHGVFVDLGTATASPPPWLARLHPESLPVTADGVRLWQGSRQAYCPSSPAYRDAAAALVRRLAERYGTHPALVMWHVNNEYGCHVPECYCELSAQAFREWLRRRYGSVAALNEAWGTAFWSQDYADWEEVAPPRRTPTYANPSQQLDFRRFSSDALLECFELERSILAELTPDIPVTTNFMGFFKPLDYWRWAAREDVVSHDSYPDPADPHAAADAAASYDLMRSLGGGRPWLLMEQTTSLVDWRPRNTLKRPGQMRLWSYQALSRGADGVLFFQWRAQRFGAHKFHGAMLPHGGTSSRVWREVKALGNELKRLDPVLGTRVNAAAAIILDWESWWALELDTAKPAVDVRLLDQLQSYYRPLYAANVAVDFVPPEGDLSAYRLLLVPNLYLVSEATAANIERFVAEGGTLVMSFLSGIVDERDHIRAEGYTSAFRHVLGLEVEEFDAFAPERRTWIVTLEGDRYQCDLWSDLIQLDGAEAIASYAEDVHAGLPAATRHRFGEGASYYLGTRPEKSYMAALLRRVCAEAGVTATLAAPAGVEVVRREGGGRSFLFALNHGAEPAELQLPGPARDVLGGEEWDRRLLLEPLGVAVLEEAPVAAPRRARAGPETTRRAAPGRSETISDSSDAQ